MNEVEVCYLNRKTYQRRKQALYKSEDEAMKIFIKTIKKFQNERTEALVVFRSCERGFWRTIKSERT